MSTNRREKSGKERLLDQGTWMAERLNEHPELLRGIASMIDDLQSYVPAVEEWAQKSRRDVRGLKALINNSWNQPYSGPLRSKIWAGARKYMPRKLAALHDSLARRLKRYDTRRIPLPSPDGVSIGSVPLNKNVRLIEAQIVDTVFRLIEHDMFSRLRRCAQCRNWLYAGRRSDQEYCNTQCRQAAFESTERRKEANRERARKAYYETRSGKPPRLYRRRSGDSKTTEAEGRP